MHGESGPVVAIVRQAFIDLGLAMARSTKKLGRPDGIFGGETESRVWQFQARTGLERDGIVALRFVQKTASKLGMQRFPLTVCIDVSCHDLAVMSTRKPSKAWLSSTPKSHVGNKSTASMKPPRRRTGGRARTNQHRLLLRPLGRRKSARAVG
jgi:peptidoglycan hydrolase-like protein with peptidoglycan-binding domain